MSGDVSDQAGAEHCDTSECTTQGIVWPPSPEVDSAPLPQKGRKGRTLTANKTTDFLVGLATPSVIFVSAYFAVCSVVALNAVVVFSSGIALFIFFALTQTISFLLAAFYRKNFTGVSSGIYWGLPISLGLVCALDYAYTHTPM